MDATGHYEVERILNHRRKSFRKKDRTEYLIRWKGFGPEEDTWEPEANLSGCEEILREYLDSLREDEDGTELATTPTPLQRKQYSSALEESASKTLGAAEIITRRRVQVDQGRREDKSSSLAEEAANGFETYRKRPGVEKTLPLRWIVVVGSGFLLTCVAAYALVIMMRGDVSNWSLATSPATATL